MKPPVVIAVFAFLLLTGCGPKPAPLIELPPTVGLVVPLSGQPCTPRMEIPESIVDFVRAQFDEDRTEPPPPAPEEDRAAYQAMVERQRSEDWANLCYFRFANGDLIVDNSETQRVVFMGDSITQSWLFADPGFFSTSRVNRGISGQTTPQMLIRFRADVIALRPAAVHILAGVNDIAGNTGPTTLEDVTNNIQSMVDIAKANGATVILGTPLPTAKFNWAPEQKPAEAIAIYAGWIRRYAAEQNLVVADYYPALVTADGAMKPELTLDGVHPNKAGYVLMKPITQAAIAEALKR